jgi:iodotyrosine deiodinase
MSNGYRTVPFRPFDPGVVPEEGARRFAEVMAQRRSVRMFSDRPVSEETIRWAVRAAGTAPSGANKQPWRYVCVRDPDMKRTIRVAAEAEEREFYERRATPEWLADLAPLGTDTDKPFLEVAPWVVVVFKLTKTDEGGLVYYLNESVGISVGLFLAAIHHAGLVALTHTPSPMGFLTKVLGRPAHERPYVVIPVGYPAPGCVVPDIGRKPVEEIMAVV